MLIQCINNVLRMWKSSCACPRWHRHVADTYKRANGVAFSRMVCESLKSLNQLLTLSDWSRSPEVFQLLVPCDAHTQTHNANVYRARFALVTSWQLANGDQSIFPPTNPADNCLHIGTEPQKCWKVCHSFIFPPSRE